MAFASKLQRLDARLATAHVAEPLPAEPAARLDELRSRIQAVIERSARKAPRAPHEEASLESPDLPFTVEESPLGSLHVRTLRLLPSHRTGQAPILAARHASPGRLARLALDPSLAGCDPGGALYVDTETTGLHGGTGTLAFLVGLAFWDTSAAASTLVVEQLLLRSPGEEGPMLLRIAARMREASMLVSFNGKAFDMPLLRTRFAMARMEAPREAPHLDLVHVARRIHKARGGSCKLKAIEDRVLGFVRENDVPSSEVSAYYLHFLRTGDTRALLGVVDHNAWDVVTMASLVGVYGEPSESFLLTPADLVGVGKTLFRAGEREQGIEVVDRAVSGGAGDPGLFARAEMAKRTGDRGRALRDFEAMAGRAPDDDGEPPMQASRIRLELAKLYEHHARDPAQALDVAQRGTGESPSDAARRIARLVRKISTTKREGRKRRGDEGDGRS